MTNTALIANGWTEFKSRQPKPGHKFVALYDDGSGAALFFAYDGGFIDQDGDYYPNIAASYSHWAYLPTGFELCCEHYSEEALALPRHVHPSDGSADRLGVWLSAALDDPNVCDAMKADIREWFDAGQPPPPTGEVGGVEPVAWRVKDYADGWIFYTDEARARSEASTMGSATVQPLFAAPPSREPQND